MKAVTHNPRSISSAGWRGLHYSPDAEGVQRYAGLPPNAVFLRRERAVGLGLAALALIVYVWTLCPGVYPGVSAASLAGVLQAEPGNTFIGHPLWACMARLAALFPFGELPFRLNLFSALCGAGVVALLFRLTTRLLYEMMQEETWEAQMEFDDAEDASEHAEPGLAEDEGWEKTDRAHHLHAMAGGVIAALAFAFCTPFWSASVSLHAQTFDLLVLLVAGHMLAGYFFTGRRRYLTSTAFLCGIGLIESVAFVILLPVILGILFYVGKREARIFENFFLPLLYSFGAGLLLSAGALAGWMTHGAFDLSGAKLMWLITALARDHGEALMADLPRGGWLLIVLQGIVPVLMVIFSLRGFSCIRNSPSRWSWGMANALLTVFAAFSLFNLPGSCWNIARSGTSLPIMPFLGIAITCGALFVYGTMLGCSSDLEETDDDDAMPSQAPRIMGAVLAASVALTALIVPFLNIREADGRKGAFVDVFCRDLLLSVPHARYFVTDGMFDANLLVQATQLHRQIVVLSANPPQPTPADPRRAPAKGPPSTKPDSAQAWLAEHVGEPDKTVFLTSPGLWAQAGFQAVPDLLVYHGERQQENINPAALMERHLALWQRIEPALAADLPRIPSLDRFHVAMRRQASRIANDLGVLCLVRNDLQNADKAFLHAQRMDPDNLCAFLNQYVLYRKHPEISSAATLQPRMAKLSEREPMFDTFARYEACYGVLHLPTVGYLANQYLAEDSPYSPAHKASPLMEQIVQLCRASVMQDTCARLGFWPYELSVPDEELSPAVLAFTCGKWHDAEMQSRNLIKKQRYLLSAWSLLANVLMNTQRSEEVQSEVLPAMRLATGCKDMELIDLTEGGLALRREQPDYVEARACFARVLKRNPDIKEAQNQLLQASRALNDKHLLESDCADLLAHTPAQPLANALLGGLRLSQGRLEDAEKALAASIAVCPTEAVLNDLAETLRQTRRLKAAEATARRALLLNPAFHQGWSTLAMILADAGNLDAAAAAHKAALDICKTDIRLYLSSASLEKKRNNPENVRTLLVAAEPLLETASVMCKADYHTLLTAR